MPPLEVPAAPALQRRRTGLLAGVSTLLAWPVSIVLLAAADQPEVGWVVGAVMGFTALIATVVALVALHRAWSESPVPDPRATLGRRLVHVVVALYVLRTVLRTADGTTFFDVVGTVVAYADLAALAAVVVTAWRWRPVAAVSERASP
ncbi:hypothetical protein [Blastococcus sp. TF02A-26]|uniref:hypothetical protein n=1 Tax=Blastococcus sp. TF02A-26 TaxID=2250577 RepID=UPI000DE9E44E|nr:hypothetical protein [Blastococcus sp. TF02A-26]RBY84682.1 hypothetical protein DQ240_13615 [Blastococcus sp. TF02A-26]